MKFTRLIALAAPFVLGLAVATGMQAKEGSIVIRLRAANGHIETFYRGNRLTDSKFTQLCAAHRARKDEINFQRDKMSSSDTMEALLKEADCLGAKRVGSAGADRHPPAQKSSTQTHAKHQRKAATLR